MQRKNNTHKNPNHPTHHQSYEKRSNPILNGSKGDRKNPFQTEESKYMRPAKQ
ncbi:MAG: hypothetical protein Q3980_11655 [Turicibacter sp.]|nr:hypothetical protein [Turicibacter sp.]